MYENVSSIFYIAASYEYERVIQSKKETIYERAKQGYAKRLEECFHANPALQTKFELFQGKNNLK